MNTKQDYLNTINTEQCKKALKSLIDTRFVWNNVQVITDEGQTDDTHRVIQDDENYIQQELIEDPNAELFRLGFTVEEAQQLLGE